MTTKRVTPRATRSDPRRYIAALEQVGGRAVALPSRAEAVEEVRRLCGTRPVVVDKHPDLDGVADGLHVVEDPWGAEVGVTGAVAAAEETGTLALAFDADRPRSTSLVPPVHVALVPQARLVPTYADAVEALAALRPVPSAMNLVTGPSSSGDIELTTVRAVHGPGEIHVVLYDE
ncbi:MAG: hypothetical protein GEV03_00440 [Streptosporangiales bacterium]|nr:hypothetical protein [Streptosporangiales bacterium]